MAAVTQATSCCSVVTVMRTGSVYIGRLKDGERETAEQMHRRGKDGLVKGAKKREHGGDRSRLIGGLGGGDGLTGEVLS